MNSDKIEEIIYATLEGKATSKQKLELDEWLSHSDENIKYFLKCKNIYDLENPIINPDLINSQKAIKKVSSEIRANNKRPLKPLIKRLGIAAATIAITFSIYNTIDFDKEAQKSQVALQPIIESNTITPAKREPLLLLASGDTIILSKTMDKQIMDSTGAVININQEGVVYSHDNISNTEEVFNHIYVPRGATYNLELSDGTKVWINSDTKIKYPVSFKSDERRIYIEGEAYFDVTKDSKNVFRVISPQNEVIVLGTSFNVRTYSDENSDQITLVSGKVAIELSDTKKRILLSPNEHIVINKLTQETHKSYVDTNLYCGWKDGWLKYNTNSLEEILTRLSRLYDVTIDWKNENLKQVQFSGEIKKHDTIKQILDVIERTGSVRFNVSENTVEVLNY